MTLDIPHGEPYAGNLHVRFDEGADVPDEGRPALLYALENARLPGFRVNSPDCGCNGFGEGMADDLPFEGR